MFALQLTAKHTKRAQNARKRHLSAQFAVFDSYMHTLHTYDGRDCHLRHRIAVFGFL